MYKTAWRIDAGHASVQRPAAWQRHHQRGTIGRGAGIDVYALFRTWFASVDEVRRATEKNDRQAQTIKMLSIESRRPIFGFTTRISSSDHTSTEVSAD